MFPGEEYVTLVSSLIFIAVAAMVARKNIIPGIMLIISGTGFLFVSLGLLLLGLKALENPATPIIGALYPSFLATGILALKLKIWRHYLIFVVVMIILMIIGTISGIRGVIGASEGILHGISGLIIISLPLYYVLKNMYSWYSILISIGGLLISIGGLALAAIAIGTPILPLDAVVFLLHPLLFISAIIMSSGIYMIQFKR